MLDDEVLPDGVTLVPLAALSTDSTLRIGGLCAEQVARLVEPGGSWPPVLLRRDGLVIDGAHRVAAARRLGMARIEATYFDGGPDDAFVEFVRRNVAQGLMLSLAERKQAAARVLRATPRWSDRRVADLCALSPKTVGRLRLTVVPANEQETRSGTEVREGRDHRLRPVRRGSVRGRVVDALQADPDASLRTIASAVGVSPETVRLVRLNLDHVPVEPDWQADSALASSERGDDMLVWLERTCVDAADSAWIDAVPLSRVYVVAEEARRRSDAWLRWAQALEARPARAR